MSLNVQLSLEEKTLNRILRVELDGLKWDKAVFDILREVFGQLRSERDAALARVEELEKALTEIARVRYGPELHWSDEEAANYWATLAQTLRAIARAALSPTNPKEETHA